MIYSRECAETGVKRRRFHRNIYTYIFSKDPLILAWVLVNGPKDILLFFLLRHKTCARLASLSFSTFWSVSPISLRFPGIWFKISLKPSSSTKKQQEWFSPYKFVYTPLFKRLRESSASSHYLSFKIMRINFTSIFDNNDTWPGRWIFPFFECVISIFFFFSNNLQVIFLFLIYWLFFYYWNTGKTWTQNKFNHSQFEVQQKWSKTREKSFIIYSI